MPKSAAPPDVPTPTVVARARIVQSAYLAAAQAQDAFFAAEVAHRIARRKAELKARAANPKAGTAVLELLIEADGEYEAAQRRWHAAHGHKTRVFGEYEVAKLMAWATVRGTE